MYNTKMELTERGTEILLELNRTNGDLEVVARLFDISQTKLIKSLEKYGIEQMSKENESAVVASHISLYSDFITKSEFDSISSHCGEELIVNISSTEEQFDRLVIQNDNIFTLTIDSNINVRALKISCKNLKEIRFQGLAFVGTLILNTPKISNVDGLSNSVSYGFTASTLRLDSGTFDLDSVSRAKEIIGHSGKLTGKLTRYSPLDNVKMSTKRMEFRTIFSLYKANICDFDIVAQKFFQKFGVLIGLSIITSLVVFMFNDLSLLFFSLIMVAFICIVLMIGAMILEG